MKHGGTCATLDNLRYRKYLQKVAMQKQAVQPQTLPPTSSAAVFHILRVQFQVMVWKQLIDPTEIDPTNWGWQLINGKLHPIYTDKPPAPDDLLKVITCKCTTDCSTLRCSCRKHGLNCSPACLSCQGEVCTNVSYPSAEDAMEELLANDDEEF